VCGLRWVGVLQLVDGKWRRGRRREASSIVRRKRRKECKKLVAKSGDSVVVKRFGRVGSRRVRKKVDDGTGNG
jgi:hypothetical protein